VKRRPIIFQAGVKVKIREEEKRNPEEAGAYSL
jgi:hypothetical protein